MLLVSPWVFAQLPQQSNVPGGVVIIPLAVQSATKPAVTFRSKPVMVLAEEGQWQAIVGAVSYTHLTLPTTPYV